jgi:hypothetical protein
MFLGAVKSLAIFYDGDWAANQEAVAQCALYSHMIYGDGEVVVLLHVASKVAIDVMVAAVSLHVMNRAGAGEEEGEGFRREMHKAGAGEQLEEGFRDAVSKAVTGEA